MLQKQAVNPELLGILNHLMQVAAFKNFLLVGGTGLALQIGHRISIDIDLFGKVELDEIEIIQELRKVGTVTQLSRSKNILIYAVNGVKVDFVNYDYTWIEPNTTLEGVRLASKADIAAMKLNAIAGRGSKKDFIDLFFLFKEYSLNEMMDFYKKKYPDGSEFLVLKSLAYFEDADQDEMPKMLHPLEWKGVKTEIINQLKNIVI